MKRLHYTESINYEIERTARTIKLLGAQVFNKLNIQLSPDEYSTLDVISCHEDICQRDLAKYILKDRANTGRILTLLENKELITRSVDTRNNRLVRKIILTKKGYQELERVSKKIEDFMQTAIKPFQEEEIKNFYSTVKRFRENIEKSLELNI